jgi:hypothetical protein
MADLTTIFHHLQRQLCGWESASEIPSEPTFSRAFAEFGNDHLPQQIHEHMVKTHADTKLVGVGHIAGKIDKLGKLLGMEVAKVCCWRLGYVGCRRLPLMTFWVPLSRILVD